MAGHWLQWTCCGLWPFGRSSKQYERILNAYNECSERVKTEISLGLPPGVSVADLLQAKEGEEALKQAYLLAIQSNNITDYIARFDSVKIPESCQGIVNAQLTKLKSTQHIIWNTMISMAVGGITIDEETLKTLLNKQAGDVVAMMEMEKLANAMKLDDTATWATDIETIITEAPGPINVPPKEEPLYDEPEGQEMIELLPIQSPTKQREQNTTKPTVLCLADN